MTHPQWPTGGCRYGSRAGTCWREASSRRAAIPWYDARRISLMQALADSYPFWILLFAVLVVVYLLPTLIGMIRGVDQLALVLLVNLIGGLTGVGWLAAIILAL